MKLVSGNYAKNLPVRFQISIFNSDCSGRFLKGMVNWFLERNTTVIEFQVADTLYRHNLIWQNGISPVDAESESRQLGHRWLHDNEETLQLCKRRCKSVQVKFWDHWITHTDFSTHHNLIKNLIKTDVCFENLVDAEIDSYFKRIRRNATAERRRHARDFLVEEISVTELGSTQYLTNEVYPGPMLEPEAYLVSNYMKELAMHKLHFLGLQA